MTMETRCFKFLFSNYSGEDTLLPPLRGKRGKNILRSIFILFYYLFTLLYAVELALSRWNLSTRWSKTAHATIGLQSRHRINPRPTRFVSGKAGECRRRPRRYQVDLSSREWEVAHGVVRSSPKPEKRSIFRHRRGIENFCRLFSTQQRPNVFVSDAWPASATYHRSFCEHCDQRVGRSP